VIKENFITLYKLMSKVYTMIFFDSLIYDEIH